MPFPHLHVFTDPPGTKPAPRDPTQDPEQLAVGYNTLGMKHLKDGGTEASCKFFEKAEALTDPANLHMTPESRLVLRAVTSCEDRNCKQTIVPNGPITYSKPRKPRHAHGQTTFFNGWCKLRPSRNYII